MNLKKREELIVAEIQELTEFLTPLRGIWANEVLNTYPQSREAFKEEWLATLRTLTEREELALENGDSLKEWPSSELKSLFENLSKREKLPVLKVDKATPYPSWALNKVSGKKQHEIENIVGLLDTLGLEKGDLFVDIGGGKGHLSRILSLYHGLNGITLDTNEEFQKLGILRLEKYPRPPGSGSLDFVRHTFGEDQQKEREIFKKAKGSFGLHTCGALALHHLDKAREGHALLNFGCCYNKLNPNEAAVSNFMKKENPSFFTKFALTLASRGHTTISLNDYQVKKLVKYKRAALHFYLQEKGSLTGFTTVGSAHPRDYKKTFSHYAAPKLIKMDIPFKEKELDDFFESSPLKEKCDFIYHANMIRWRFGRILEKLLILDRTLSLIERGQDAYCFEIFDSSLSPRNIGIMVNPKKKPH